VHPAGAPQAKASLPEGSRQTWWSTNDFRVGVSTTGSGTAKKLPGLTAIGLGRGLVVTANGLGLRLELSLTLLLIRGLEMRALTLGLGRGLPVGLAEGLCGLALWLAV